MSLLEILALSELTGVTFGLAYLFATFGAPVSRLRTLHVLWVWPIIVTLAFCELLLLILTWGKYERDFSRA